MNSDRFRTLEFDNASEVIEVSDWGIEESINNKGHIIGINDLKYHNSNNNSSPTLVNERSNNNKHLHTMNHYYSLHGLQPIRANTANFRKYVRKYISLHKTESIFWEKSKYCFVISNLLDNSLILSKNENSLRNYISFVDKKKHATLEFVKWFADDGIKLTITNKLYRIDISDGGFRKKLFFMIHIILLCLPWFRSTKANFSIKSRAYLFKIILFMTTRFMLKRRVQLQIQAQKTLNLIDEFLISNLIVDKKLLTVFLYFRQSGLFGIEKATLNSISGASLIYHYLEGVLNVLILNTKLMIAETLPYLNAPLFERYCHVNEVALSFIIEEKEEDINNNLDDQGKEPEFYINSIKEKLKRFNNLRKLFISELLALSEKRSSNYFVAEVADIFEMSGMKINMKVTGDNFFHKMILLERIFCVQNSLMKSLSGMIERLDRIKVGNISITEFINTDIFSMATNSSGSNVQLDKKIEKLADKLEDLSYRMKYFRKYNDSLISNSSADELNQKLIIFKQFNEDISKIQELYSLASRELNQDLYLKSLCFENSSCSPSSKPSKKENEFNLKSFHTPTSNSNRELSSSSHNLGDLHRPLSSNSTSSTSGRGISATMKRGKRVSTGLQLGLLTVVEEQNVDIAKREPDCLSAQKRHIDQNRYKDSAISSEDCFSDGSNNRKSVSYEIMSLDPLSRANYNRISDDINISDHRFSLISMNSNVSGISDYPNSSQTAILDEEIDDQVLPKNNYAREAFRRKLEGNMERAYGLTVESKKNFFLPGMNDCNHNSELNMGTTANEVDSKNNTELNDENDRNIFLKRLDNAMEKRMNNV